MNDDETDLENGGGCPATNRHGEPCGHPEGWGTDSDSGPCKHHGGAANPAGGAREGAGAPARNTNSVTHGAYADENSFYQEVLDDDLRELVDEIYADYVDEYESRHGAPMAGLEMELFRLSVSHVKDVVLDNWATERPDDLESTNPLVDKETRYTDDGGKYHKYKESVVLAAQKRLSSDRRSWLKDLGLLEDPESQTADAVEGIISVLSDEANSPSSSEDS